MEGRDGVVADFKNFLQDHEVAVPLAAIQVLIEVIQRSPATTLMGLQKELENAGEWLLSECRTGDVLKGKTEISVRSGCALFLKFVTRTFLDIPDFNECKKQILDRGKTFVNMSLTSRSRIADFGDSFIRDRATVLTHGYSRVVTAVLSKAAQSTNFNVLVTEGHPGNDGYEAAKSFAKEGIPVTVIPDMAVAFYMERIDLVLSGAEGVVENGGILNRIGTYQIAIIAHALKKPFYVAAESTKFARMYPLNQRDLNLEIEQNETICEIESLPDSCVFQSPTIDYTPPEYITLLFTDLGVLTPAAVSDELIQLYQ